MWDTAFSLTNAVAMLGWAVLAFAPRTEFTRRLVLLVPIALLCLAYAVMLIGLSGGWLDGEGQAGGLGDLMSNYSVDGLMGLFQSRGGIVVGWTHYLAFDLFVGWWIAGDADRRGFPRWRQVPVLFLTLMAGPLGLLTYLVWTWLRKGAGDAEDRG